MKIGVHGPKSGNALLNKFVVAKCFQFIGMTNRVGAEFEGLFVCAAFQFNEVFVIVLMDGDANIGVGYDGNGSQRNGIK